MRDFALWQQHNRSQASLRGVGGHRCRCIAGGGAGDGGRAQPFSDADAERHAAIFEGAGWVFALVLEPELLQADKLANTPMSAGSLALPDGVEVRLPLWPADRRYFRQ